MRVTLLMPNRNTAQLLDLVLDRLAASTTYPNAELLVVDDGSTDASREIVRKRGSKLGALDLRLIEREHGGVVHALNAGLAEASGKLVVQLDSDVTIDSEGWLEKLIAFFCSHPSIGVVTAKVVFDWGELQSCGVNVIGPSGLYDRGTELAEPIGQRTWHGAVRRPRSEEGALCERIVEVDSGIGCCMMYRRDVALKVGGYDAGFSPVWFDDIDLCLSIRRAGLKVFFHPEVRVVHHVGARIRRAQPTWRRVAGGVRRRAGALSPAVARVLPPPRPQKERRELLASHRRYWETKWGFDILNPEMAAVQERWGDTEICWQMNPEMRAAGERVVQAYTG